MVWLRQSANAPVQINKGGHRRCMKFPAEPQMTRCKLIWARRVVFVEAYPAISGDLLITRIRQLSFMSGVMPVFVRWSNKFML